jgi:TonB family protein
MITKNMIQRLPLLNTTRIYIVAITIFIALSGNLFAQDGTLKGDAYVVADEMPSFKGGQKSLMDMIYRNLTYPQDAEENGIEGKVIVRFIVTSEGKPTQFAISKGLSPSIDRAALDAVSKISNFTPGKIAGKPVNVWYAVPINFKIAK